MQILLGNKETIIKINSSSIGIEYIQHYISSHFLDTKIENNFLYIPSSAAEPLHRQFLLKWIYTLYVKKTQNSIPELKESLVKRHAKAIKIEFKEKVVYKINYKIIDNETLHLSIVPKHHKIVHLLKIFLQVEMHILPTYIQISFKEEKEKKRLHKFLSLKKLIDIPYIHIYDKESMYDFLSSSQNRTNQIDSLKEACLLLGISQKDNLEKLKKNYKTLAKKYHPDKAISQDEKNVQEYTKKFQEILEAYEFLLQHFSRNVT